jgi:hypothetical protein
MFDGRPPDHVLDIRFRFQDPLVEHVMRAAVGGGSRLFLESAAVLILERLARVPSVETRLAPRRAFAWPPNTRTPTSASRSRWTS